MIVPKLCPYDFFFISSKISCTLHNSVIVLDIFMKVHSNVSQVKIMCRCFLFLIYGPLVVLLCLFCIIDFLVHAITHSEFSKDDVSDSRINIPHF